MSIKFIVSLCFGAVLTAAASSTINVNTDFQGDNVHLDGDTGHLHRYNDFIATIDAVDDADQTQET